MGFWDKAFEVTKNVGAAVATQIQESANETRELKLKYDGMNNNDLLRIVHSDGFLGKSPKEKAIAFGILRGRGLSNDEINAGNN